ncbi:hypothetical protein Ancab_033653, partial [Ancistrocladus abbreviatus]
PSKIKDLVDKEYVQRQGRSNLCRKVYIFLAIGALSGTLVYRYYWMSHARSFLI